MFLRLQVYFAYIAGAWQHVSYIVVADYASQIGKYEKGGIIAM